MYSNFHSTVMVINLPKTKKKKKFEMILLIVALIVVMTKVASVELPLTLSDHEREMFYSMGSGGVCSNFFVHDADSETVLNFMRNITTRNILRSVVLSPDIDWIAPIARQGSVRLLCLGGSNTAKPTSYVTFLQENIGRIFPDRVANRSQLSYVINRGISAHGPEIEHFAFEDELPVDEWPNLVTLEFSLNINGGVKSQKEIDELIYYINRKYERRNVLPPRYLFLDFWRAKDYYNKTDGCIVQDKDELLNTIRYTRGTATPPAIRTSPGVEEIARFYGYPLIGTRELFWDVFFEYYITHGQCLQRPTKDKPPLCWPMQDDCVHLNCYSGRLVSNVVILPLLMNEIVKYKQSGRLDNPLDDCTYTDRHSAAVKMFPEDTYSDYDILSQVEIWSISPHDVVQSCDGFSFRTNKTSHICILDRNEGWHYSGTAGHFDGLHDTLSSSAAQYSSIVFGVAVYDQGDPSENVRIHLDIDYLVSWNTAVFGEMECIFHNQGLNESETRFLLLPNKCDGELVTSTGMCTIRFPVELKHNQFYRLECKKLNNKMVGFGKFTILRKRVL